MRKIVSLVLVFCLTLMLIPVQEAKALDLWGVATASSGSVFQYWLSSDAAANFAFFGGLGVLVLGALAYAAYDTGQRYQMETMRQNLIEAGCREDGNGGWVCPDVQSGP